MGPGFARSARAGLSGLCVLDDEGGLVGGYLAQQDKLVGAIAVLCQQVRAAQGLGW